MLPISDMTNLDKAIAASLGWKVGANKIAFPHGNMRLNNQHVENAKNNSYGMNSKQITMLCFLLPGVW